LACSAKSLVTLIPLLLLFEMMETRRFPNLHRLLRIYAPFSAAFVVYVFFRIRAIEGFTFEGQYHFGYLTVAQCVLNQIVLFSTYLKVYFFPVWLNAFHTFRPVLTFSDQRFVMAGGCRPSEHSAVFSGLFGAPNSTALRPWGGLVLRNAIASSGFLQKYR
jgi:hypothetical protein